MARFIIELMLEKMHRAGIEILTSSVEERIKNIILGRKWKDLEKKLKKKVEFKISLYALYDVVKVAVERIAWYFQENLEKYWLIWYG